MGTESDLERLTRSLFLLNHRSRCTRMGNRMYDDRGSCSSSPRVYAWVPLSGDKGLRLCTTQEMLSTAVLHRHKHITRYAFYASR